MVSRGIRTRLLVAGWGDIDQRQTIFLSMNNLADDDLNACRPWLRTFTGLVRAWFSAASVASMLGAKA